MLNGIDRRAILSIFPLIGPFIGAYNVTALKTQAAFSNSLLAIAEAGASAAAAENNNASLRTFENQFAEHTEELSKLLGKEIIYSKAALIGNLVNLIGVITLIALDIFTGPLSLLIVTSLAIGSIIYTYNLYSITHDRTRHPQFP